MTCFYYVIKFVSDLLLDRTLCDKVCQWLASKIEHYVIKFVSDLLLDRTLCDKVCQWLASR